MKGDGYLFVSEVNPDVENPMKKSDPIGVENDLVGVSEIFPSTLHSKNISFGIPYRLGFRPRASANSATSKLAVVAQTGYV